MSGTRDLPADLVERAAQALADLAHRRLWDPGYETRAEWNERTARAVLSAVADHWPTPTTHRDQLAAVVGSVLLFPGKWHDVADAILAAGVLRDAAHVETEARADERAKVAAELHDAHNNGYLSGYQQAGEDIARAIERAAATCPNPALIGSALARSIARDTTAGTT